MSVETVDRFLALLTLAALAGVAGLTVLMVGRRFSPAMQRLDTALADAAGAGGHWLAWLVAAGSMAGSLYYSDIVGYAPCSLCWYQRIAMYPLVVILAFMALRNDSSGRRYALTLSAAGGLIAAYQYVLGYFPDVEVLGCSLDVSCTVRYIWEFGFVDFPFMSLVAFALIASLVLWTPVPHPGPEGPT